MVFTRCLAATLEFGMQDLSFENTSISLGHEPPPPPPPNRRSDPRHLTLFRVGAISIAERRELCLIKNISSGGMSIHPYSTLSVGIPVVIELKSGMSVPGSVAWVEDGTVGVAFDAPVDILDVLSNGDDRTRPRMPRIEIDCQAIVRDGAAIHRMRVCDISQGGVKLAGELSAEAANDLAVTLPGMTPLAASLRWRGDGHVGLTFNRLLALPELVEWLHSIREQTGAA
ncbi:MAG TPA: PilZ domain-containing protein [Sphingomicrobium sp.]|nr:PilZ domain-containing protein [Sphingomicrobium sp.]